MEKTRAVVVLSIDADTPHRVIEEATGRGLEAARQAMPEARVQADGAMRNAHGRKRVEISLRVTGSADAAPAQRALADAFLATLAAKGHEGERVA